MMHVPRQALSSPMRGDGLELGGADGALELGECAELRRAKVESWRGAHVGGVAD